MRVSIMFRETMVRVSTRDYGAGIYERLWCGYLQETMVRVSTRDYGAGIYASKGHRESQQKVKVRVFIMNKVRCGSIILWCGSTFHMGETIVRVSIMQIKVREYLQ